jgi:hypothetical protein
MDGLAPRHPPDGLPLAAVGDPGTTAVVGLRLGRGQLGTDSSSAYA